MRLSKTPAAAGLLVLILLTACQSQPGRPEAGPNHGGVELAQCSTAHDAFLATLWQQNAAEYRALSLQVYARAEAALARALTTAQLVHAPAAALGASACVFDDVGAYEAIGAAEHLLARGVSVTLATRHPVLAPRMQSALVVQPALERLRASGRFTLVTRARLEAIEPERVRIAAGDGGGARWVPAETLVLVLAREPDRELEAALRALGVALHVVGDARDSELLPGAIAQGHAAGRAL